MTSRQERDPAGDRRPGAPGRRRGELADDHQPLKRQRRDASRCPACLQNCRRLAHSRRCLGVGHVGDAPAPSPTALQRRCRPDQRRRLGEVADIIEGVWLTAADRSGYQRRLSYHRPARTCGQDRHACQRRQAEAMIGDNHPRQPVRRSAATGLDAECVNECIQQAGEVPDRKARPPVERARLRSRATTAQGSPAVPARLMDERRPAAARNQQPPARPPRRWCRSPRPRRHERRSPAAARCRAAVSAGGSRIPPEARPASGSGNPPRPAVSDGGRREQHDLAAEHDLAQRLRSLLRFPGATPRRMQRTHKANSVLVQEDTCFQTGAAKQCR